jgi:hypothetical protein
LLAIPAASQSALESLGTLPPAPSSPAGRIVPRFSIEVADRSQLPPEAVAQAAKTRAALVADDREPGVTRFSIPKTKAYAARIMARLLAASGLAGDAVILQVEDTIWGDPNIHSNAGVVRIEPEAVAIMESEDQVAALLAQGAAHAVLAHSEKLAAVIAAHPRTGGSGDAFGPGPRPSTEEIRERRAQVFAADALGARILANAGYDAGAAADALRAIREELDAEPRYLFIRDHQSRLLPSFADREAALRAVVAGEGLPSAARTTEGFDEIYQELKHRRRPDPTSSIAADLYSHYRKR